MGYPRGHRLAENRPLRKLHLAVLPVFQDRGPGEPARGCKSEFVSEFSIALASIGPYAGRVNVIHAATDLKPAGRKVCVAIGVFDGVHLGHQQVIRHTIADAAQHEALAVVITFDQHPNAIVAPDRVPPLIYSLPQKLRAIASLGVEATWLIRFDEAFSRQSGEEFVRAMTRDFGHLHSVCVGSEFTFGHQRSGNVALLKSLGAELRFAVHGIAAVSLDGQPVSSTRIREAIRAGQFDTASQMLGRGYSLAGLVIKGDQLGRKLGFPTANVDARGLVLPPNGVYAAHVHWGANRFRAVLNIGSRPTISPGADQPRVEAHLLDFHGDLYGEELEITFISKLRDERKFPSADALKEQIVRDIKQAGRLFEQ
jgi:riboflavin kinase/FMN adenylyltransferase